MQSEIKLYIIMSYLERKEVVRLPISIKAARVNAGLSQKEVADNLDMSVQTYGEYENHKRVFRVDTAVKFSKIVELPFNGILFFDETTV